MGDPNSDLIFSIDIGVVNVGVALYNKKTKKIMFADKLSLAKTLRHVQEESEYVPRVYALFFDPFASKCRKMIDSSSIVLVEKQMTTRMINIQHIISGFCVRFNINYKFVSPRSIKAFFKTGSYSRKLNGTNVKGVKNNHSANKKLAVAKANELFPEYMDKVNASKKDDVADAILQAVWYAEAPKINDSLVGESPFYLAIKFDPNTFVPPKRPVKKPAVKKSKKRKA